MFAGEEIENCVEMETSDEYAGLSTFKWSGKAVDFLLNEYHMRIDRFRDPSLIKKSLWFEILQEMHANGFQVANENALDAKMRNLKRNYRNLKENLRRGQRCKWQHFSKMDAIFSTSIQQPLNKVIRPSCPIQEKRSVTEENIFQEKAVKFFLNAYHKRKDLFHDPEIRQKDLWYEILQEMRLAGFQVEDEAALGTKLRNMKRRYIYLKNKISTDGGRTNWLYFDKMDEIFSSDYPYDSIYSNESNEEVIFVDKNTSCITASSSMDVCEDATMAIEENKWQEKAVKFLLNAYHKRKDLFRDSVIRKKDLWYEILQEMRLAGFQVADEEALDIKMRNMKHRHKYLKNKISTDGGRTNWLYFDKMEEIFSSDRPYDPISSHTQVIRPSCSMKEKRLTLGERWQDKAVKFFLNAYHKRKDLFLDPEIRKKKLWYEILQEMRLAGFEVEDEEALDIRMRNMKRRYRLTKNKISTDGGRAKWQYFDKMDEIFSSDYPYDPISAIEGNEEVIFVPAAADSSYRNDPFFDSQELPNTLDAKRTAVFEASLPQQQQGVIFIDENTSCITASSSMDVCEDAIMASSHTSSSQEPPSQVTRPSCPMREKLSTIEENRWKEKAVKFLLNAYHKRKDLFLSPVTRKKDLWYEILQEMRLTGYQFENEETLHTKMRNMKRKYKQLKNEISTDGGRAKWQYFDKMDEIFSSDCPYDPISAIEGNEEVIFVPAAAGSSYRNDPSFDSQELPNTLDPKRTAVFEASLPKQQQEVIFIDENTSCITASSSMDVCEDAIMASSHTSSSQESPTQVTRPSCPMREKLSIIEENRWQEKAVKFLLDAYDKRKDLFLSPVTRKKDLWYEILQEMRLTGYQVENEETLHTKMRNMKRKYKQLKNEISTDEGRAKWQYFDKMDQIFSSDCPYDPMSSIESNKEVIFVNKNASCITASPHTPSSQEPPTKSKSSVSDIRRRQLITAKRMAKATSDMRATLQESKLRLKDQNYLLQQLNVPIVTTTQFSDELDEIPCKNIDFGFEFINTSSGAFDPDIDVKSEPFELEEVDDDNNESNCGEIRLDLSGTFVLVCGFCREKHNSLIDFGLHLMNRHEDHLKSTIAVECLDTTDVEDVEAVYATQYDTGYEHGEEESSKTCNNCGKSFIYKEDYRSHQCERSSENVTKVKTFAESIDELPAERNNISKTVNETFTETIDELPAERNNISKTVNETFAETIDELPAERNNVSKTVNVTFAESIDELPAQRNVSEAVNIPSMVKTEHKEQDLSANETEALDPQTCQCKYCTQEFETSAQCTEHESAHIGEKPYLCCYCQQTFRTYHSRDDHVRLHTGERPFKCIACSIFFAYKKQLDCHMRSHRNLRLNCRTCGKVFYSESNLRIHERRHTRRLRPTKVKPFICEQCGKTFNRMSTLSIHLKRHAGIADWKCKECGKGFYSKNNLKGHMAVHSSEAPFECYVCGMKFTRYSGLFGHLRIHSEETHACSICGKTYGRSGSLQMHMKSHRKDH